MPVRNAQAYIALSVSSLLRQTLDDFELLVINDGSTDETLGVLASIADRRIRVLGDDQQRGISFRLNEGLGLANGLFIARMDADDIAAPSRLARQVEFLDSHAGVDLVGTAVAYIDEDGNFMGVPREYPVSDFEIKCRLLTSNCLLHPTVMFRQRDDFFRYSTDFYFAQDYELWLRMGSQKVYANLPEVLLLQRRHCDAVSAERRAEQKGFAVTALQRYARDFAGFDVSDELAAVLVDPADQASSNRLLLLEAMELLIAIGLKSRETAGFSDATSRDFVLQEVCFFVLRGISRSFRKVGVAALPPLVATLGKRLFELGALSAVPRGITRYLVNQHRLSRDGRALHRSLVEAGWRLGAAKGGDR